MNEIKGTITAHANMNVTIGNRSAIGANISLSSIKSSDYETLRNKPSIEDVPLIGNKTLTDFGDKTISLIEIQGILDRVFD